MVINEFIGKIAVVATAVVILTAGVEKTSKISEPDVESEKRIIVSNCDTALKQEEESKYKSYNFIPLNHDMQLKIQGICEEYTIEYSLVIAIIKTETEFDMNAVGDYGNSVGLMQIQPKWWQWLADKNNLDIFDPEDNVCLGVIILDMLIEENEGDLEKALKQYNSGDPNYESNEYVEEIFENYKWAKTRIEEIDRKH